MSTVAIFLIPAVMLLMLSMPLIPAYRKLTSGKKARGAIAFNLIGFFGVCALGILLPVSNLVVFAAETGETVSKVISTGAGMGYIAAAIATGMSSLGAGIAVAAAAPAAIGATSEDPKSFGKSLIFVALGEGVALYGLLIAVLIISSLG